MTDDSEVIIEVPTLQRTRGEDEKWIDPLEKHCYSTFRGGTMIKTGASLWAGKLTLRAVCSYTHTTDTGPLITARTHKAHLQVL
jgi:hypothetical protein